MVPPRSRGRGRHCPRLPCPCRDPIRACSCNKLPNLGLSSSSNPAPGPRKPRSSRRKGTTRIFRPFPPPPSNLAPLLPVLPSATPIASSALGAPGRGFVLPNFTYRDALASSPPEPPAASRPSSSSHRRDPSLPASPPHLPSQPLAPRAVLPLLREGARSEAVPGSSPVPYLHGDGAFGG